MVQCAGTVYHMKTKLPLFPGLYQRGDIYWFRYQVAGMRISASLRTSDLAEAIDNAKLLRSNPTQKGGETILGLMEVYLAFQEAERLFTRTTVAASRLVLLDFGNFTAAKSIASVTPMMVRAWFEKVQKRASKTTAQTQYYRVRSFFTWCMKERRLIDFNPTDNVKIGRFELKARLVFCTREERDKLIDNCPSDRPDLKFILMCGFYAGMRRNEIVEARPDWFDIKGSLIHVQRTDTFLPKDREDRTVPMAEPFQKFLRTYEMSGKFCICDKERGKALLRYDFRRPFRDHVLLQGLPHVTPHIMRKTFASLLASSGVSIYKVALWLGDDVRVVQDHYARLLPETSEINKL